MTIMSDDTLPTPKTEPIALESGMEILCDSEGWKITVGGAQQPQWKAKGETLEDCIADLVLKTTEDAIQDEAIEWDNHIRAALV